MPRKVSKRREQGSNSPLMSIAETCQFFGGDKPIDPATLYRGIKTSRFPRPIKIGPGISRWHRAECEAALKALADAE
jgi:predicted DNA-binding transcriptional regulator AlpA